MREDKNWDNSLLLSSVISVGEMWAIPKELKFLGHTAVYIVIRQSN